MTLNESNVVDGYLRGRLAGIASARSTQLSNGFVRADGKIAGLGCCMCQIDWSKFTDLVESLF